eukprot:1932445-Lingulodinium_polyedra.AAC.1
MAEVEFTRPPWRGEVPTAYPTEARERQKVADKAAKFAGVGRKTRKKAVERRYDDCGESTAGLGEEVTYYEESDGYCPELIDASSSDADIG